MVLIKSLDFIPECSDQLVIDYYQFKQFIQSVTHVDHV